MARVMICDDDKAMVEKLAAALVAAGHVADTCCHTMDMLRGAAEGRFDLIAFALDMAGFGRTGAVEALHEVAPQVPLIGLYDHPSQIVRAAAQSRFVALLPRPVAAKDFMYAVACAFNSNHAASLKKRPDNASALLV